MFTLLSELDVLPAKFSSDSLLHGGKDFSARAHIAQVEMNDTALESLSIDYVSQARQSYRLFTVTVKVA